MTKQELISYLSDSEIADDAQVCLSSILLHTSEDGDFEVIFDYPVAGIAYHPEDNEIRFVVSSETYGEAYQLAQFGVEKVELVGGPSQDDCDS
ncbi:MAG: hypothetical protein R3213_08475 [Flavobacteriaceae bacterium]|nr:hypothetical protein [Flavobacteriaceae bacterium]